MIRVADSHLPHLFNTAEEAGRRAPPRAVLKGIGKAIGMMCGPVERDLPHDLAVLVQRLPGAGEPGIGRGPGRR